MSSQTHSRKAVSLGEVLVAAAVLAMVFLALIQIFPTAYADSDQSADAVTAAQLLVCCPQAVSSDPSAARTSCQWPLRPSSWLNSLS